MAGLAWYGPHLPGGAQQQAGGGATDITHATLTVTPTMPAASVDHSITHQTLTVTPTMPAARVDHSITHQTLTVTPTMPAASLDEGGAAEIVATLVDSGTDTTDAQVFTTGSVDFATDELALLFLSGADGDPLVSPPVISGGGFSSDWVLVDHLEWDEQGTDHEQWIYRNMQTNPTSGTISMDMGVALYASVAWAVVKVTGVKTTGTQGADAIRQVAQNEGDAATASSVTLGSAGLTDNRPIAAVSIDNNEVQSPRTDWTELADLQVTSAATGFLVEWRDDAMEDTASSTWSTSLTWGAQIVELAADTDGGVSITHATLTTTPSLPAARIDHSLTHQTLTITPTYPQAATGRFVTHVTLTTTPSLPAASVAHSVAHATLTTTPSFPTARIDRQITHATLTVTPTQPQASITLPVSHVTLTTTPSLPAARIDHSISHVTLTTTPTMPQAVVRPQIGHVTLTTTPTMPAARIDRQVTHVTLTTTPTLPQASVTRQVTHTTLTTTPSLPAARVDHSLTHSTLTVTPTMPAALISEAGVDLIGHVTLSATPSLPAARIDQSITHSTLTTTPSLPAASLAVAIGHATLTVTPTQPASRIDISVTHSTYTITPELPPADLVEAGVVLLQVDLAWAEMEVPLGARSAQVGWVEMVLQPGDGREGWVVSKGDLGLPGSGINRKPRRRPRGLGRHFRS